MQNAFGECYSRYNNNNNVFQHFISDDLSTDNPLDSTKESKSLSQAPDQQEPQADTLLAEVRVATKGTSPTFLS